MNSQHSTRSSLWSIPLICNFTVISCLGIANADTNVGNIAPKSEAVAPLDLGMAGKTQPGLVGYLPSGAYILEFIIRNLANILDDPTLDDFVLENDSFVLENADASLKENADLLILGYPLFGVDSSLTQSETETGLDDAYILLDILKNEPELVSLDEDTQFELIATAEAIIEELEDAQ